MGEIAMIDEFRENYRLIGLKVAYYRKVKGLTQEKLADIMGVDTSFIGQIEAPNFYKAISMDYLAGLTDQEKPYPPSEIQTKES